MRRFCLFLAASVVLGGGAWASPSTAASREPVGGGAGRSVACRTAQQPFTPTSVTIPRVVGPTKVLARGRDRRGVPLPPPLTDRGKWEFAWDKASRIRPGTSQGVVRMTAHTYPRDGRYGLALGNRLLARLHTGDALVVSGAHGERLCYRVARRIKVRAEQSVPAYYASSGRPRLAILVCSGTRRGPGDWSHRTIWFAVPVDVSPPTGQG
jgi:hypothetical protein